MSQFSFLNVLYVPEYERVDISRALGIFLDYRFFAPSITGADWLSEGGAQAVETQLNFRS
jgi:hypothetical protein